MSKLEQFQLKKKLTDEQLAHNIGISRMALHNIKKNKSSNTKVVTCAKIYKATGLSPWEYIDNINCLKKICKK